MYRFYPAFIGGLGAFGLLLLRLVAGSALILHGWPKIQNAFEWMGPQSFAPGWLQAMAAVAEFGGGIALILGLLIPLFSFLILCTMATAVCMVHLPKGDPFVAPRGWDGGSYELALGYFAIALLLMLLGPGTISLDALLFRNRRQEEERSLKNRTKATVLK